MSGISAWQVFVWVALPYLALGIFVVGHVWRWRYDQFGWTSRSTQLQERRLLKWGVPPFHYGTFAAIGGHVIGVLIPESWTHAIGIPENVYWWFSARAGTLAAVLIITGVVILAGRRLLVPPVAGDHQPGRLPGADPATCHHRDRGRSDPVRQPVRPRLRLPQPQGRTAGRARHRRPPVAQDRRPLLGRPRPSGSFTRPPSRT
jgi:hypothetical protein